MVPTYGPGEYVWALRRVTSLHIGDVVVVRNVGTIQGEAVKRVTGFEGSKVNVEGDNGEVSVDSRHFGPVEKSAIQWVIRPQRPAL